MYRSWPKYSVFHCNTVKERGMKTILVVGKLNETVKDLNAYLSKWYKVQVSSESAQVFGGMMKVVHPDLVLVSLIGMGDVQRDIFNVMEMQYPDIPVVTIGTEGERRNFLRFFENSQFENLIRPIDNADVEKAIAKRLELDPVTRGGHDEDNRPSILVVDDNAATLRSIKTMLDDEFDVTLATSGMKAMTMIGKRRPDLILLDYEMPVCDGKQTLEMIRSEEDIADIPVVFLTGVNDRQHIQAVLALKPSGYMLKPAVRETLVAAIKKALA